MNGKDARKPGLANHSTTENVHEKIVTANSGMIRPAPAISPYENGLAQHITNGQFRTTNLYC